MDIIENLDWTAIIIIAVVASVLLACVITFFQMKKKYIDNSEEQQETSEKKRKWARKSNFASTKRKKAQPAKNRPSAVWEGRPFVCPKGAAGTGLSGSVRCP